MSEIPPNSLFSALAFIGFILAGLPLPWHMQSWNTGTCMYMLWTSLGCLVLFVNSVVWNDNVINWAPVWCDICTRYLIGAGVGIPASSLCIIRRLYYITKLQRVSVGRKERRREIIVDVSIGIGLPCVVVGLEYVVQIQRFSIFEQIGCYPADANTLATYLLINMWPLLIGLINLVYAVLTFHRAFQQKRRLKEILNSGFSIGHRRYWCLMALCSSEIILTVPLSIYFIIINAVSGSYPYVSWAWVHSDISQIGQYPTVVWQSSPHAALSLEMSRWMYILFAFLIFGFFFGLAQEARGFYHQAFLSLCRRLGYPKPTTRSKRFTYAGTPKLPVHDVDQQMRTKHPSIPAQARVRHHPLRTSLSAFEAPSRSESLRPGFQLSVDEELTENTPRLSSLDLARHTHISCANMPAAPEPALVMDRCSRISNLDVDPLA